MFSMSKSFGMDTKRFGVNQILELITRIGISMHRFGISMVWFGITIEKV